MSDAHLEPRDADLGDPPPPPTPEQFASQASDGRQGDAISDQPFADAAHHDDARDAVAWDETTQQ